MSSTIQDALFLMRISCSPGGACKSDYHFYTSFSKIKQALIDDVGYPGGVDLAAWYGEKMILYIYSDENTILAEIDLHEYIEVRIGALPLLKFNESTIAEYWSSDTKKVDIDSYSQYVDEYPWYDVPCNPKIIETDDHKCHIIYGFNEDISSFLEDKYKRLSELIETDEEDRYEYDSDDMRIIVTIDFEKLENEILEFDLVTKIPDNPHVFYCLDSDEESKIDIRYTGDVLQLA